MKMRAAKYVWLTMVCLVVIGLISFGCGAGNVMPPQSTTSGRATGRATFTVNWPKPTRLIPTAANSIVVQILSGTTVVASQTLSRPPAGGSTTATFNSLGVATLTATATAYPNSNGTGVAQASASTPLTIVANQNTPFSLTMGTTITQIQLSPNNPTIYVGHPIQLTATARDASGNIVLTVPQTLQWVSSNKSIATVDTLGNVTGVAVGVGPNAPAITVTETESGVTASTNVVVEDLFYSNTFASGTVDSAWTTTPIGTPLPLQVSYTPKGNRPFLGELAQQKAILTLNNLPLHSQVTVTFDLFIILTWDGNAGPAAGSNSIYGPDIWQLQVANGPTLLNTTFSNWYGNVLPSLNLQAFPDSYPGGVHPAQTGATEANTLGYVFSTPDVSAPDLSSVYHLSYTFNHSASSLELDFNGMENEPSGEYWGLTNVVVTGY